MSNRKLNKRPIIFIKTDGIGLVSTKDKTNNLLKNTFKPNLNKIMYTNAKIKITNNTCKPKLLNNLFGVETDLHNYKYLLNNKILSKYLEFINGKDVHIFITVQGEFSKFWDDVNTFFKDVVLPSTKDAKIYVHIITDINLNQKQTLNDIPRIWTKLQEYGILVASISGSAGIVNSNRYLTIVENYTKELIFINEKTNRFKYVNDYVIKNFEDGKTNVTLPLGINMRFKGIKKNDVIVIFDWKATKLNDVVLDLNKKLNNTLSVYANNFNCNDAKGIFYRQSRILISNSILFDLINEKDYKIHLVNFKNSFDQSLKHTNNVVKHSIEYVDTFNKNDYVKSNSINVIVEAISLLKPNNLVILDTNLLTEIKYVLTDYALMKNALIDIDNILGQLIRAINKTDAIMYFYSTVGGLEQIYDSSAKLSFSPSNNKVPFISNLKKLQAINNDSSNKNFISFEFENLLKNKNLTKIKFHKINKKLNLFLDDHKNNLYKKRISEINNDDDSKLLISQLSESIFEDNLFYKFRNYSCLKRKVVRHVNLINGEFDWDSLVKKIIRISKFKHSIFNLITLKSFINYYKINKVNKNEENMKIWVENNEIEYTKNKLRIFEENKINVYKSVNKIINLISLIQQLRAKEIELLNNLSIEEIKDFYLTTDKLLISSKKVLNSEMDIKIIENYCIYYKEMKSNLIKNIEDYKISKNDIQFLTKVINFLLVSNEKLMKNILVNTINHHNLKNKNLTTSNKKEDLSIILKAPLIEKTNLVDISAIDKIIFEGLEKKYFDQLIPNYSIIEDNE